MMGAKAVVAPIEKGPQIAQPNARRDESLLGSQAVETTIIKQKQSLEPGREKVDVVAGRPAPIQQLDEAQGKAAQVSQSAAVWELGAVRIAGLEAVQATEAETKQWQTLDQEPDRADPLGRELTSVRNELESANRQIAALNASDVGRLREPAADSSQVRMAEPSSSTIEGKECSPEQISGEAVTSTSGRSSVSELLRPEPRSTAREAASDLDPKVAMATERSASTRAASRSLVDEQRLLDRGCEGPDRNFKIGICS
jgi:hypothetical protein